MLKTDYELRLQSTAAGTGYFACLPVAPTPFEDALAYLRQKPLDSFMHKYVLDQVAAFDPAKIRALLAQADGCDPVLEALLHEAVLLRPDRDRHRQWTRIFADNMLGHHPLPDPAQIPAPCYDDAMPTPAQGVHVKSLRGLAPQVRAEAPRLAPRDTAAAALARLEDLKLLADVEMRHVASLSPIALLRHWHLKTRVRNGKLDFSFSGVQTSYGRGLALLESLLAANGFEPVYIDLTRQDIGFPVVKALVPGLELSADFDEFSRVSRRLYRNYLSAWGPTLL